MVLIKSEHPKKLEEKRKDQTDDEDREDSKDDDENSNINDGELVSVNLVASSNEKMMTQN